MFIYLTVECVFQCSVSCGGGRKQRKVWCMLGSQKVSDDQCNRKLRPVAKKECHLKECPEWYPGGWGPVSSGYLLVYVCVCMCV